MKLRSLALLLVFCLSALGQVYYIDATLGNDANPGTLASPWQTLSFASQLASSTANQRYKRYSQILLKKGETFTGPLTLQFQGDFSGGNQNMVIGAGAFDFSSWQVDIRLEYCR